MSACVHASERDGENGREREGGRGMDRWDDISHLVKYVFSDDLSYAVSPLMPGKRRTPQ